jgi:hypothetical protein
MACGYNCGVVAPVMLFLDGIYDGITVVSKAVSQALESLLLVFRNS